MGPEESGASRGIALLFL